MAKCIIHYQSLQCAVAGVFDILLTFCHVSNVSEEDLETLFDNSVARKTIERKLAIMQL